jgi:putative membrane protein
MTMMWDWNGARWWWWVVMSGGMVVFWGFIAWLVVQIVGGERDVQTSHMADPEATLAARFARGDIDADEYQRRLDVLRDRRRGRAA